MKFSIALDDLESLLRAVLASRVLKADTLTLSACAARVFVASKGVVAGMEALVFADGAVTVPAKAFCGVLKTYKGTRVLVFEGGADGLRVQNFRMPVLAYNRAPKPPGDFQVFHTSAPPGTSTKTARETSVASGESISEMPAAPLVPAEKPAIAPVDPNESNVGKAPGITGEEPETKKLFADVGKPAIRAALDAYDAARTGGKEKAVEAAVDSLRDKPGFDEKLAESAFRKMAGLPEKTARETPPKETPAPEAMPTIEPTKAEPPPTPESKPVEPVKKRRSVTIPFNKMLVLGKLEAESIGNTPPDPEPPKAEAKPVEPPPMPPQYHHGTAELDREFIKIFGKPVLIAALKIVRNAYCDGKPAVKAIEEGIAELRTKVEDLDESKALAFFQSFGKANADAAAKARQTARKLERLREADAALAARALQNARNEERLRNFFTLTQAKVVWTVIALLIASWVFPPWRKWAALKTHLSKEAISCEKRAVFAFRQGSRVVEWEVMSKYIEPHRKRPF